MTRASQWRIYYHRMFGKLSTTCSNIQKKPNGELLVAVNHNQLRIMASETVDPIDWSHPLPSWAVPHERFVRSLNQSTIIKCLYCAVSEAAGAGLVVFKNGNEFCLLNFNNLAYNY